MLRTTLLSATLVLGSMVAPTATFADEQADPNVNARHALMGLMAYNIGVLGGMAQGRMPYDSDTAQAAATSLYHLARVDQSRMWPEGTDNFEMDHTRALPALWENMDDVVARMAALQSASETMMNVAGTDLASVQGAIGALGGACGGCHRAYRQPE